ncbi:MAG: hypothetical protein GXP62_22230 [Oligoflexia bacterium]|nr:hypothetical protein [Oligoflexia bacterium]
MLVTRQTLLPDARHLSRDVVVLEQALATLRRGLATTRVDLSLLGKPFAPSMTVDQAWRRHSGAAAVFACNNLPACDGCAVRFDETLEEAAAAYGLNLSQLLADLNALLVHPSLGCPPRSTVR